METIYKYLLPIQDEVILKMPKGAKPLTVQVQGENVYIWAIVDSSVKEVEDYYFDIFGTGFLYDCPSGKHIYFGTIQLSGLVFHVFRRVSAWDDI